MLEGSAKDALVKGTLSSGVHNVLFPIEGRASRSNSYEPDVGLAFERLGGGDTEDSR
jgi:hypothetical protein